MSANKDLWKRVSVTDPKAVKPITGKQYSGNSPKPYWIVERLTDEFGPCGIGWGFTLLSERFEHFGQGAEAESLHVAAVRFWYMLGEKRGELEQVGQTRAAYTTSKGKFLVDEDAPKKSVTDALVKCASYLGFAGDIFSGRWDDSKYVAEANLEWREREAEKNAPSAPLSMSPRYVADWQSFISEAGDVDDLNRRTKEAHAAATEIKDRNAYAAFSAAKKKRAAQLGVTA